MDALLTFEQDLPRLKSWGITPGAYRILAISSSGPLAQAYVARKLGRSPIEGFATTGSDTLQVTTLLAAFDWNSTHSRYPSASDFTAKFFALLPELRSRNPKSPLRKTDVRAAVPGWQRLDTAAPLAAAAAAPSASEDGWLLGRGSAGPVFLP